jgi:hypothetical protein
MRSRYVIKVMKMKRKGARGPKDVPRLCTG